MPAKLNFLTDENVSPSTIKLLRELGHDVLDLKELKQFGKTDAEVFELAKKQNRIIFTLDTDFKNRRQFPPDKCGGIIVSAISPSTPKRINPKLKALLISTSSRKIKNNLIIIEERRWRFLK